MSGGCGRCSSCRRSYVACRSHVARFLLSVLCCTLSVACCLLSVAYGHPECCGQCPAAAHSSGLNDRKANTTRSTWHAPQHTTCRMPRIQLARTQLHAMLERAQHKVNPIALFGLVTFASSTPRSYSSSRSLFGLDCRPPALLSRSHCALCPTHLARMAVRALRRDGAAVPSFTLRRALHAVCTACLSQLC